MRVSDGGDAGLGDDSTILTKKDLKPALVTTFVLTFGSVFVGTIWKNTNADGFQQFQL